MEELVDVLDENGKKIGVCTRAEVHEKGLWHKSVHVWIVSNSGKLLLQKRCKTKKFYPNVWDCAFAGHVDYDESSLNACLREGKEELGIELDEKKLKFLFTNKESLFHDGIVNNEFVDIFVYEDDVDLNNLTLQADEVSDVKMVEAEKFFQLIKKHSKDILYHSDKEYEYLENYIKNNLVCV